MRIARHAGRGAAVGPVDVGLAAAVVALVTLGTAEVVPEPSRVDAFGYGLLALGGVALIGHRRWVLAYQTGLVAVDGRAG